MAITDASEPSNIIWENLSYTKNAILFRKIIATFIALIIYALLVTIQIIDEQETRKAFFDNYEANPDCDKINQ